MTPELPAGATLHPWNQAFDWAVPTVAPVQLSPTERAGFDRDGFVVLPELLDQATVAALVEELDELEAEMDRLLATQVEERIYIAEAGAITFTVHAVLRSAAARALATHPAFVGLCHDLVGPDVNLYWDQAVYKKRAKPRRFPWHQDNGYVFVEPQQYLTIWLALTDTTLDNGCPWILPGVHRAGTLLHHWVDPIGWECFAENPDGAVAAELPAGGAVVFSSLTPHLTGPNLTDAVRKAYIVQYAPVGVRRLEGDWQHGDPPNDALRCDDPERQFAVLRGGTAPS
ncbi:MAG TPA: phytanoyl-CoA dioxygenase family protein [Acidimicrobiia bacterium]|nr:phytanoyl-CoA dioxygenase family protein [Acidimicrobiia bacterium]